MRLTKDIIEQFEKEQEEFGTETALYNIIFLVAWGLLKDIGIKNIKTKE